MRALTLCLMATLAASPVVAATTPTPWLEVDGAWATYAMSDVNDDIATINAALADSGVPLRMDEVKHGFGFGITVGLDFPAGFALGVTYGRLFAKTEVSDFSGGLTFDLPANVFGVRGLYRFQSAGPGSVALGFGAGRISEAGSINITDPSFGTLAANLEGSGAMVEGFASATWRAAPHLALVGSAGYRYAKVPEIRVLDQIVLNPDGSKYSVDYSGAVLRAGFQVVGGH